MMRALLKRLKRSKSRRTDADVLGALPVFQRTPPAAPEMREIENAFVRVFTTDDGMKVLSYLQGITFHRALSATATDEQLRYVEGQRALLASILRLIERGRRGSF